MAKRPMRDGRRRRGEGGGGVKEKKGKGCPLSDISGYQPLVLPDHLAGFIKNSPCAIEDVCRVSFLQSDFGQEPARQE